ncbi:MAG: DUF167 domain-containing protein [Candidatus Nealsonbacteria bacterium]
MKIFVKVKPAAKEDKVEKINETTFYIEVKEPPVKGRANAAVIRTLADYFGIAQADVKIISGYTSRLKTIEIK